MLVGQHLGRSHQRGRMPRGHGTEHGGGGNDGLATAHIAVEEAVHRMTRSQIVEDLAEDFFLGGGKVEGKLFEKSREQRALSRDNRGFARSLARPLPDEDALHFEKFLARQLRTRRLEFIP